jgi:hypothetical protein
MDVPGQCNPRERSLSPPTGFVARPEVREPLGERGRGNVMMFIDRATHQYYLDGSFALVYPKVRPKRPGRIFDRCQLHIFVLLKEPRVFVGGGEFGFDNMAREADTLEIEALAERFDLPELREVLSRRASNPNEVNTT